MAIHLLFLLSGCLAALCIGWIGSRVPPPRDPARVLAKRAALWILLWMALAIVVRRHADTDAPGWMAAEAYAQRAHFIDPAYGYEHHPSAWLERNLYGKVLIPRNARPIPRIPANELQTF